MAPMASTDADLSNLSAAELVSRLRDKPGDLDAVVRVLSAREAQHKAVVVAEIQEEIHDHLTVALSKIHESQEEGAFLLEATLSGRRSGRQEESVVAEIYAGQKARLGRIAAETRAKVKSSFSKLLRDAVGASETVEEEQPQEKLQNEEEQQTIMQEEGDQHENEQDDESDDEELDSYERAWHEYDSMLTQSLINLGNGRGRGRGRGTSPAEAQAAAAGVRFMPVQSAAALRFMPVQASPEELQRWMLVQPSPVVAAAYRRQPRAASAAPLSSTIAVGRSSDSILRSKGKALVVEYINPEDEQDDQDGASSGTS